MGTLPIIATHLASLNLFREPDGTVEITVAAAGGAVGEWQSGKAVRDMNLPAGARPVDYIEELIIEAADRMRNRRESRK